MIAAVVVALPGGQATVWLILALALLTHLSRAASLLLLPLPSPAWRAWSRASLLPCLRDSPRYRLVTTSRDPSAER